MQHTDGAMHQHVYMQLHSCPAVHVQLKHHPIGFSIKQNATHHKFGTNMNEYINKINQEYPLNLRDLVEFIIDISLLFMCNIEIQSRYL
jgi:hypothetical protein